MEQQKFSRPSLVGKLLDAASGTLNALTNMIISRFLVSAILD